MHKFTPQKAARLKKYNRPIITGQECFCYRTAEALNMVKTLTKGASNE